MTATTPRADAQRNRARVLAAAEKLFASKGLAVPLDEIARTAGVGAGTVYRHFPTKDALLEAVMAARIAQLSAEATAALDIADPVAGFFGFLGHAMERARVNTALCDAIHRDDEWRSSGNPELRCDFRDTLAELLARAQGAGAVREDVSVSEVTALIPGYVVMANASGDGDRVGRLLLDALRPERATDLSRNGPTFHNDRPTEANERHETRCAECGTPLETAATGRRPKYCGAACRQRAHRKRVVPTAAR